MKKPNFNDIYDEFSLKLTKISEIKSQFLMMQEMLKLPEFFEKIWIDGYKQGVKDGRKIQIDYTKKNN